MSALREMTWRDIPRLARLEAEIFARDAWSEAVWWAELAGRPRRDYIVLENLDDPRNLDNLDNPRNPRNPESLDIGGYAGLDHGGDVADIMTVAVAPGSRGRGHGDRLVRELVGRASRRGASAVLLEVRADNAAARALYRRNGFEEISVRHRYYQPDGVDAVVLRLLLDQGT